MILQKRKEKEIMNVSEGECSRVRNRARTVKQSLKFYFPIPEEFNHRIITGNVYLLLAIRQTQLMRQLIQEGRI